MKRATREFDLLTTPEQFFFELVSKALCSQKVSASKTVEIYLVNLLSHFLSADLLKEFESAPLALQYHQAATAPPDGQLNALRQLGDYSLYISGFFSESLNRKIVDVDYYIAMGERAYDHLSGLHRENVMQKMFGELSKNFPQLVDVLTEVSHSTQISTEHTNILRIYEKWLLTKSDRLKALLAQHGLIPIPGLKTIFNQ
ncbi:MAG TPA: hypothetical protein VJL87_01480 [Bdellovibrionota bacterium]|nr:hypothetical protein [Bdellovibrionota bacterium]